MSMRNFNDTIGNRNRSLPACSAVPQIESIQRHVTIGQAHLHVSNGHLTITHTHSFDIHEYSH